MRELITFPADPSQARSAQFKAGIRSLPYLADHGFQDMVVLPGSFYVDMALLVHREIFHENAGTIRNVKFLNPAILSDDDTVFEVEVRSDNGKPIQYSFRESGSDKDNRTNFGRLEIDSAKMAERKSAGRFSIEEFKARAGTVIEALEFYRQLRANGNQYGPRFQNVAAIWRFDDQVLGKLTVPRDHAQTGRHYLHPTLVDSITQLLAAFTIEQGQTFILESIDRIDIRESSFPETLWAKVTRRAKATDGKKKFVGDIDVFDESGKRYLELDSVAFAYLDRGEPAETGDKLEFCIASTFTAEPVEDSLKFWSDRFGISTNVRFAPYNQIFQQLLGSGSDFRKNSDGLNAILLGLEDWIETDERTELKADRERLDKCFGNHLRCVLPNGLEIVHLNQYETDYLYQEIFRDQCYLRHGIRLHHGDTIIDIGANIGMFSVFVMSRCRDAAIYAFEPSPVVYELLRANCEAYGTNVHAFECGVSDKAGMAEFTFYEKSSVFSGFHSDAGEDREAIEAVVRNTLRDEMDAGEPLEGYVGELTADRLRRQTYQCRLISVSDIIRENRIERIHLLKIDAEKSELDILKGIEERHWPMIDQIVIEIHDRTKQAVDLVERLLVEKGYRFAVEQEKLLENSGLFNIYATRLEQVAASPPAGKIYNHVDRNIDEFCAALNSFMPHSTAPMLLCVCPRSPEAENRAGLKEALDAAEQKLLSRAAKIANVHSIDSRSILKRYPLREYYDPHSKQLGHVPYTPEGYVAIGTTLFRTLFNLTNKPLKVMVLDCDNILWQGVCGEDGPDGVQITEAHRALQEFAVRHAKAGLLICLCSKNNERDVFDVFDQRKEMVLKREHLVSSRINWNPKSENIKELAAELNLGLESFLFLDDNPVECAEVRINCPEVLTLQLPERSEAIPSFLSAIWGLGEAASTEEDRKRTRMYQENIEREQFREQTVSLQDFLNGLQLRIELAAPTKEQLGRVSQLTYRTNQFNFTTIRRSENEIRDWLGKENRQCLVASVSDRFGDYGLVGVFLYETTPDQFTVDTFLLSCRVLGRGVEHHLLSDLGRRAQGEGKRRVELRYLATEKNSPALEFVKSLDPDLNKADAGALTIKLPTAKLVGLQYEPEKKAPVTKAKQKRAARPSRWLRRHNRSDVVQGICDELSDIDRIAKAVEDYRYRGKAVDVPVEFVPEDTLEAALSNIWKKVLGRRQIGLNDNFFEAGGTSLKAVQVIALVQKQLKKSLSITTLFECPTIKLLAAKLKGSPDGGANRTGAAEAQIRGQQRRYVMTRRKSAAR